jgi:hypothetical protein
MHILNMQNDPGFLEGGGKTMGVGRSLKRIDESQVSLLEQTKTPCAKQHYGWKDITLSAIALLSVGILLDLLLINLPPLSIAVGAIVLVVLLISLSAKPQP